MTFRSRVVRTLLVLVALAAIDFGLQKVGTRFDLTAEESNTLAPETLDILGRLTRPVKVTAFYPRQNPDRLTAGSLLLRYRRTNARFGFRIVDPEASPSEAQRFGVDPVFGGIALELEGRVEIARTATEQDVTAALARLERPKPSRVCIATGHGEADPASTLEDGFAAAELLLRSYGYHVETLDLLADPSVPRRCEAIVMAAPRTPLGAAQDNLAGYLEAGGRAVFLTDPVSQIDLTPLIRDYGFGIERGIVLESDPELRFPDDPTRPIIARYSSANPIVNRMPPTFYPGAQAVVTTGPRVSGLVTSAFAQTSADSYLERKPLAPKFDATEDIAGPISVAAAADLSGNFSGKVIRTRIVVFGDVDFATNAFLSQAGNSTMLARSVDWAILEEDLVTLSANIPALRVLDLTEGRIAYSRFLLAGVIPAMFLLLGAAMWASRRSR